MKQPDRRISKTKKSIRDAYIQLIKTNDFHRITVTEIAKEADIDRKTFYYHYSSTYDVLKEIETIIEGRVLELLEKEFNIESFFIGLNELMIEHFDLYNRIAKSTDYLFLKNNSKNILKSTLTESFYQNSGLSKEEFNVHAEYISSGIIGMYIDWLGINNEISLEQLTAYAKAIVENNWNKLVR